MLKSLVGLTLCGWLMFNSLQASARPRGWEAPEMGASTLAGRTQPARQMQKFVNAYIRTNDEELAQVRERSVQPFTIIDSVMEHYDLPVELRYLAVIESDLQSTAVSRVGAKGPWQLMAGTARELGLTVTRRSDERTNYYRSTGAAALYLRDLHREFKDWLLVLAAYNAGPGPVIRAIRLSGSRNFWVMERYLPAETRMHVRRFIATAYYFAVSGPVVDPVPVRPGVGQPGGLQPGGVLPGGVQEVCVRQGMTVEPGPGLPGMTGAGLSDGVSGDVSGVGSEGAGTVRRDGFGVVGSEGAGTAGNGGAGTVRSDGFGVVGNGGVVVAGSGVMGNGETGVAGSAWRRNVGVM